MNLLSSLLKFTADTLGTLKTAVTNYGTRLGTAETKVTNMEAQLATAISAVTVDSEVQNVRVGDDNVTYTSAGEAVRTQFSNVKSELRYYSIENLVSKKTDSKRLDSSGNLYTDARYFTTDYIPVTGGKMYFWNFAIADMSRLSTYDSSKGHLGTYNTGVDHMTLDNNVAYVRLCNVIEDKDKIIFTEYPDIVGRYYRKTKVTNSDPITAFAMNDISSYFILQSFGSGFPEFAGILFVFRYENNASSFEIFKGAETNSIYIRYWDYTNSAWKDWDKIENDKTYYVKQGGSGFNTFSTLKSCTEYIKNNNIINATVYVEPGIYDLVTEFGQTYYDNIDTNDNEAFGLFIGNNTHYIFAKGATVVSEYAGSNVKAAQYFSAFNVYGSFVLENAKVVVKNARYCVHEDLPSAISTIPDYYIAKYINCDMEHGGNTIGSYTGTVCIGAGTNKNSVSIISGGTYKCTDSFPYAIAYHNFRTSLYGNYPSKLVIENAWINNGVRLQAQEDSNVDVIVNNCYMPSGVVCYSDLFTIKQWGNVSA